MKARYIVDLIACSTMSGPGYVAPEAVRERALPIPDDGRRNEVRVKWDRVTDLGKVADRVIAARLGITVSAVKTARHVRGIPPVSRWERG